MKFPLLLVPLSLVIVLSARAEPEIAIASPTVQQEFLYSVKQLANEQGLFKDALAAATADTELLRFGNSVCMARRYNFQSRIEQSYRDQANTCPKAQLMVTAAEAAQVFLCPDLSK